MSDQLDVLKLLTGRLEAAGLPYLITGSIAAGLYGQPRMTRDIDIVAVLHPPHASLLADLLGPEFICDPEVMADAIARRRIFSVVHREALQKVDFIVREDRDYELEKFDRRRLIDVDGQSMWVISPEHLVLSKPCMERCAAPDRGRHAWGVSPMRDTSPEADAAFTALFAARSASDRVRMACDMFDAAKALVAADIRARCPGISPAELRVQMFDRLCLGDFDAVTRARILSGLR